MILCVVIMIGWILTLIEDNNHKFPYCGFIGGILGVFIPMIYLIYIAKMVPTALDVYQGKTTLEITYKDSIPVDSVVVFKDKK